MEPTGHSQPPASGDSPGSRRVAEIERRLRAAFDPQDLKVVDESPLHVGHAGARGGAGHFAATIVSVRFADLAPVKRHRLVYDALGDLMPHEIHALSVRALTPDER